MTYRVKGTLKLPDGSPAANCEIEFVSRKNLSPVVQGSKVNIMTSATGYYDVTLEFSDYAVILYTGSTYPAQAGFISVLADTTPGQDLPTLLGKGDWTPATPEYIQQIEAWLVSSSEYADAAAASALAAANSAQDSADSAAETAGAITAHEAKPSAHPISGVSGLQSALDGKEAAGSAAAAVTAHKAESNAHEIADITGLSDALASIGGGGGGGGGGGAFGGQYRNLSVNVSGVGYQGTITVERLVVESEFFATTVLRDLSLSFDAATSGAGGLDAGSVAAGKWYYIYVIYNSTTKSTSSLLSLSSSDPTLPAGYTHLARVGAARSITSSFRGAMQRGAVCKWGASVPCASDSISMSSSSSFSTANLESRIPPTTKSVILIAVSSSGSLIIKTHTDGPQIIGTATNSYYEFELATIDGTFFYKNTSGSGSIYFTGYIDVL